MHSAPVFVPGVALGEVELAVADHGGCLQRVMNLLTHTDDIEPRPLDLVEFGRGPPRKSACWPESAAKLVPG